MTNTSTTRTGASTGLTHAVTRYQRPGPGPWVIRGVSGPQGLVEYAGGGIQPLSYHASAPLYAGHKPTPCPGYAGTCYHRTGDSAGELALADAAAAGGETALYRALGALYWEWALGTGRADPAAEPPVRLPDAAIPAGRRAAVSAVRPGRRVSRAAWTAGGSGRLSRSA